jgi:hypothetical protein
MEQIQERIDELIKAIEANIEEALKNAEKIQDAQKADMAKASSQVLENFRNGEPETYEEMKSLMGARFEEIGGEAASAFARSVTELLDASVNMAEFKNLMLEMRGLIDENKALDTRIGAIDIEIDELEKTPPPAPEPPADRDPASYDPIGFSIVDPETGETIRFDFFVDRDGDGQLSDVSEFLGATDFWQEMIDLDTDKDGIVSLEEMQAGGIMVAVTGEDGVTRGVPVAEIFERFGIDHINLADYKANEAEDKSLMDWNGNLQGDLLGNFFLRCAEGNQVEFNGQVLEGYNTLDLETWLDENYTFSQVTKGWSMDGASQQNPFGTNVVALEGSRTSDFEQKLGEYMKEYRRLENELNNAWVTLGKSQTDVDNAKFIAEIQAQGRAGVVNMEQWTAERVEAHKQQEAEWAEKHENLRAELAAQAETADVTDQTDEDAEVVADINIGLEDPAVAGATPDDIALLLEEENVELV